MQSLQRWAFAWPPGTWPALMGGGEVGKEEAHSKSSYSVDASNLKVGYDPGDHFLVYTVPTWQKMMFPEIK